MENTEEPAWVAEWVERFLREPPIPYCLQCHRPMVECLCIPTPPNPPMVKHGFPMAERSFSGILPKTHCEICLNHRGLICLCAAPAPMDPSMDLQMVAHREAQGAGGYRGAPWQEPVKPSRRWWPRFQTWLRRTPT